ncbi:DUF4436 family protein [Kitasatospora sp. NPDC056531]|uniref:DUF4436 family protein n=1 Tax=Kitasatospora sp. NPDC056531 TaxID=3345856 RepID=UPI0036C89928
MSTPPQRRATRSLRPTTRQRVRIHTRVRAVSATRPKARPWRAYAVMVTIALLVTAGLLAAWLIVWQRRGIIWPALSWMAATLFALVGMRNAAPGNPPIGSLLDYAAFFWAELLVAVGLTMVVVRGARVEGAHRPTT